MAPIFNDFRNTRKRLKRTLRFGPKAPSFLNCPLTECVVDYFDAHSPYDFMDMQSSSNISRRGYADPCSFVVALVYLDRLRVTDKEFFETSDPMDLYLPALILASKYLHDADTNERATNWDWAEAADISMEHLNELEWDFVKHLDWNTRVSEEEYERKLSSVEQWVATSFINNYNMTTYNELSLLTSTEFTSCIKKLLLDAALLLTAATAVYTLSIAALLYGPSIAKELATSARTGIACTSHENLEIYPDCSLPSYSNVFNVSETFEKPSSTRVYSRNDVHNKQNYEIVHPQLPDVLSDRLSCDSSLLALFQVAYS